MSTVPARRPGPVDALRTIGALACVALLTAGCSAASPGPDPGVATSSASASPPPSVDGPSTQNDPADADLTITVGSNCAYDAARDAIVVPLRVTGTVTNPVAITSFITVSAPDGTSYGQQVFQDTLDAVDDLDLTLDAPFSGGSEIKDPVCRADSSWVRLVQPLT